MPHIPTKSKLMRGGRTFAVPPICKSKTLPFGTLTWEYCDDPGQEYTATYSDIDFETFMGIVDEQQGTKGTWTWQDNYQDLNESGTWNNCPPPDPGYLEYANFDCITHESLGLHTKNFDSLEDAQSFLNSLAGEYGLGTWHPDTGPEQGVNFANCGN